MLYRPEGGGARLRYRFIIEPDLYSSEPVNLARFCQRVAVLSRPRGGRMAPEVCKAGLVEVDTVSHRAFVSGADVPLTALEFRLLVMFMASKERVLSREQLLRDVWGIRAHADTRTVDTNVKRLRQKLGVAAPVIETIRNVGYRFKDPAGSTPEGFRRYAGSASAPIASGRSDASGESPSRRRIVEPQRHLTLDHGFRREDAGRLVATHAAVGRAVGVTVHHERCGQRSKSADRSR